MAIEETLQSGALRYGRTLILLTGYLSHVQPVPPLSLYAVDSPWSLITLSNRSLIIYFQVIFCSLVNELLECKDVLC